MTTATREDRWRHGRHLSNAAVCAFLAVSIAVPWLPNLPRIANALITVGVLGVLFASFQHTRELCERCIGRVPLDPTAAVNRSRPALKAVHRNKVLIIPIVVFVLAGMVLPEHSWWAHLFNSLAMGSCLTANVCTGRHRLLEPWCPFCHRGDGDDNAELPAPTGGTSKPVPA